MYLGASIRFQLKEKPKGYLGLVTARYTLKKYGDGSLGKQLVALVAAALESAADMGLVSDTEKLQVELDILREYMKGLIVDGEVRARE